jgi:hypothetical protein
MITLIDDTKKKKKIKKIKDKESLLQSPSGSWKVTNSKTDPNSLQSSSGSWKVTSKTDPIGPKKNLFPDKLDKSGKISGIFTLTSIMFMYYFY